MVMSLLEALRARKAAGSAAYLLKRGTWRDDNKSYSVLLAKSAKVERRCVKGESAARVAGKVVRWETMKQRSLRNVGFCIKTALGGLDNSG